MTWPPEEPVWREAIKVDGVYPPSPHKEPIRHRHRRHLDWEQLTAAYMAGIGTSVVILVAAVIFWGA